MHNCIFTAHCTETVCDKSCPVFVETAYLLERNNISMNSKVFNSELGSIKKFQKVLQLAEGSMKVVTSENVVSDTEMITYCAICQNWQGSRLHCNVYNLKYSRYIEELKNSWSSKSEPEALEYMRIWANTAKVLIISNLDFVNFKDFEAQTLLNLIQSRQNSSQTTIIVLNNIGSLVGSSFFLKPLKDILRGAVVNK